MKHAVLARYILVLLSAISGLAVHSQQTTIGLQWCDPSVSDGYTLFTPLVNSSVYLIDNCGEKINEWNFNEEPGATCYLLQNGNLLRAGTDTLQIRDWDNNVLWTYPTTSNGIRQHHDIEPLPNGNILCVVRKIYPRPQMIAQGRDPSKVALNFFSEGIVELMPIGSDKGDIVWEWKFNDHFIQDFDSTKLNYGVVADHPELLDLNFDNGMNQDYIHLNAIDYNDSLDQIMITARHLSEIYIIDHSTTTAEAASHSGGISGRGGDFLWRWGNPQVYRQGGSQDQKLFRPHDGKWVEPGYLDEGKITVFNNGLGGYGSFSSVDIITPEILGGVYSMINNRFFPLDFEWSWSGAFFGDTVSELQHGGAHSTPNGNIIICESSKGRVSEITKNDNHLWSYVNPSGFSIYSQYSYPTDNEIFRGEKYPPEFLGFTGQNLAPISIIENVNNLSDSCIANSGDNSVNGVLHYKNLVSTPIDNTTVLLKTLSGTDIDTTLTDFDGSYSFSGLPNGDYIIDIHPKKVWGGVNSSDALGIMLHFAGMQILSDIYLDAADVDTSDFVNTKDALMCVERFVGLINEFPSGDWIQRHDTINLFGVVQYQNIQQTLCYGDINGSYLPPQGRFNNDLKSYCTGYCYPDNEGIIELPVSLNRDVVIGAISLVFTYPQRYLELVSVDFEDKNIKSPVYKINGDEIRIGWFDLEPLDIKIDETFLLLKFAINSNSYWPEYGIKLELEDGSELSDQYANSLIGLTVYSRGIKLAPDKSSGFILESNYPNPFNVKTEIYFNLPESAFVDVIIYNIIGSEVRTVKRKEYYKKGGNRILIEKGNLSPGVYIYTLDAVGERSSYSSSRTMIVKE